MSNNQLHLPIYSPTVRVGTLLTPSHVCIHLIMGIVKL